MRPRAALALAQSEKISAIVTRRTIGMGGIALVRDFRRANARVPIVMVSGIDRTAEALAAGANRFLLYDEWLRIGTIVAELLGDEMKPPPRRAPAGHGLLQERFSQRP